MVKLVFIEDPRFRIPAWADPNDLPVMVTATGQRIRDNDLIWFIKDCLPTLNPATPLRPIGTPSEMAPAQVPRNRRGDDARYDNRPDRAPPDGAVPPSHDAGPQPFATGGMDMAFSDAFSFLGNEERDIVNCSAVDAFQKIATPMDDGKMSSDSRKAISDASLDKLLSQRDQDVQKLFGNKPPPAAAHG